MPSERDSDQAGGKVEVKPGGGFNLSDSAQAAQARLAAVDLKTAALPEVKEVIADMALILGIEIAGA